MGQSTDVGRHHSYRASRMLVVVVVVVVVVMPPLQGGRCGDRRHGGHDGSPSDQRYGGARHVGPRGERRGATDGMEGLVKLGKLATGGAKDMVGLRRPTVQRSSSSWAGRDYQRCGGCSVWGEGGRPKLSRK